MFRMPPARRASRAVYENFREFPATTPMRISRQTGSAIFPRSTEIPGPASHQCRIYSCTIYHRGQCRPVNPADFDIHYHEKEFRLQCHERTGADFQRFFEDFMVHHDPSFTPVKSHGNQGDWKNDGWIPSSGTLFQCYSPESTEAAKIIAKINEDFAGAMVKWAGKMKAWIFVYSEQGKLPPMVVSLIENMKVAHPGLTIDTWNRERLWSIVRSLTPEARNAVLGPVPRPGDILSTTAEEIRVLLGFLARVEHSAQDAGTSLLDLLPKLAHNRLGPAIRDLIEPGLPVAQTTARYLSRHPDPGFSATVSQSLAERYRKLVGEYPDEPEQLFFALIRWVQAGKSDDLRFFWAAVGIVSHYFELCDIFES
mgnify:CR=1 FL=1